MQISKIITLIVLLLSVTVHGQASSLASFEDSLINKAAFEKKQLVLTENKGQLADTDGNLLTQVFFKVESRDVDLYISETGFTYIYKDVSVLEDISTVAEYKDYLGLEHGDPTQNQITVNWERIDLILDGANIKKENIVKGTPAEQGHTNYFYGHCPDGIHGVRDYNQITIKEVYPSIDWIIYITETGSLKYDFQVHSGADPSNIRLIYSSKEKLRLLQNGNLEIPTSKSNLTETSPVSFFNGSMISSTFKIDTIRANNRGGYNSFISFELPDSVKLKIKNTKKINELIIDPELVWSTAFGGSHGDIMTDVEIDNSGNAYFTGYTTSIDFPLQDGGGYYHGIYTGPAATLIVVKFNSLGVRLWATYYGSATSGETGRSISIDESDNVFVIGWVAGFDMPLLDNGTYFQDTPGGGMIGPYNHSDILIIKFDSDGNRLWATLYGGFNNDFIHSSAIDSEGSLYITGSTFAFDLPMFDGGGYFDNETNPVCGYDWCTPPDGFIVKFDNEGNQLWGTYFGGEDGDVGVALAIDTNDHVFLAGFTNSADLDLVIDDVGYYEPLGGMNDIFLVEFDTDQNVVWGTFFGSNAEDRVSSLAFDSEQNLFMTGWSKLGMTAVDNGTYYYPEPLVDSQLKSFIAKFTDDNELVWSTFLETNDHDDFYTYDNLSIDACDNIYWTFTTASDEIPFVEPDDGGFYQTEDYSYDNNIVITKFSNEGSLLWGSLFGGEGKTQGASTEIDQDGSLWMTGSMLGKFDEDGVYDDNHPLVTYTDDSYYQGGPSGYNFTGYIAKFVPTIEIPEVTLELTAIAIPCNSEDCSGAVTLDVTGATGLIDVIWSNGESVYNSGESTFSITDLCEGYYVVEVYMECYPEPWIDSIKIEKAGLGFDLLVNEPTCFGFSDGSITINVLEGGDDLTFVITDSEGNVINEDNSNTANTLNTGWYYFEISDGLGCDAIDSVFLDHPGQMDIDITLTDPLCYGFNTGWAQVDSVYNATGVYDAISYIWNPNPAEVGGIFADSSYNMRAGNYTLTINDDNGCSSVFDFEIEQPDSMFFSEFGFEPAFCRLHEYQSGNGVVFGAAAGGTPDYSYLWMNWDNLEESNFSTWGGLNPGNYELTAVDANGCILKNTVFLDSLNPIADFSVTSEQLNFDLKGTAPVEAVFTNLSENFANPNNPSADTTFFWNLDRPLADWQVSHDYFEIFDTTYIARGETYMVDVCLVALNKNGCRDTACKVITIFEPIAFVEINIFSPNGDGINDAFSFDFRSASIAEFSCVIVNRWGVVIHEMNNITDEWDGSDMNGDPCNDGVYFYNYMATTDNGTNLSGQGTVQIVSNE